MNNQVTTFAGPHSARPSGRSRAGESDLMSLPVLIRVPSLSTPHLQTSARTAAPRVRRRLKSEVRVAAATLIFAMPLSWGLFALVGWSPKAVSETSASSAIVAVSQESPTLDRTDEPMATISLRTTETILAPAPAADEIEAPVVVPAGYLVPDEAPQETSDAGY